MDNKELLSLRLKTVSDNNLKTLWLIRAALVDVYGEENIMMIPKDLTTLNMFMDQRDFKTTVDSELKGNYYEFIIRFPEILLKSQTGKTHLMRDLFVRFHMNSDLKFTDILQGLRTTFTDAEYLSNYGHSHLAGGRALEWNRFCTGSGPINVLIANLKNDFDLDHFVFFLHNLKSYVGYESISGTPYNYISNIGGSTACPTGVLAHFPNQVNLIYKTFITTKTNEELMALVQPSFDNGRLDVKMTDAFEEQLYTHIMGIERDIRRIGTMSSEWLSSVKKADGTYVSASSSDASAQFRPRVQLKFKKESIKTKLISSERNSVIFAHPEISKYVINKIYRSINRAATKFSQAQ